MTLPINPTDFYRLAETIRQQIGRQFKQRPVRVYGIPNTGIVAAAAVADGRIAILVDRPDMADAFVDDLIDSGATAERYAEDYPDTPFFALLDKHDWDRGNDWVIWPWEGSHEAGIKDNITRLLQYIGENPDRGGLSETPDRVAKAWKFWSSGYEKNPEEILKSFEDGAEHCDEMVVVRDIPFYTHCEHHLAPFFGTATIGYVPNGKIVGLSKLNRLLDMYARRLQVQERLTSQVANALMKHLEPKGAAVVIKARHLCMESRGVCQQGHHTITSALRGCFKEEHETRNEFLRLAH